MRNVRRRMFLVPVLATLLLGVAAAGQAEATARQAAPAAAIEEDHMIDAPGNGPAACVGGAQEAVVVRTNDLPTNLVENGALAPLPGASQAINVPNGDTDLI